MKGKLVRVFVSGPMAGRIDQNRAAFAKRAQELIDLGHEPFDPSDVNPQHEGPCIGRPVGHDPVHRYGCRLRAGITALMHCDAISMLDEWEQSVGAVAERTVAKAIGLQEVVVPQ